MAIIISKNGKNALRVDQSSFGLEGNLQEYIINNPDSIPLYDIEEDIRLFIAAREFVTKSGPIDALGFDQRGNIYVVETKLYKNPDKRTVVAQALDYGASLWRHSVEFDSFISQLDVATQKQFQQNFSDKLTDFFALDETTDILSAIHQNLTDGSIKFVVLMDSLHDALKDLVLYVNQNSKFDLYAVELEFYKHAEFEIIIPKLYGAEVKKEVSSTRSTSAKPIWAQVTEDDFRKDIENHFESGEFSTEARDIFEPLHTMYKELCAKDHGRVTYWRVQSATRDVVKAFYNTTDDKVAFCLESDSSLSAYPGNKQGVLIEFIRELLQHMIEASMLKRVPKHSEGSQWFINLKHGYASQAEIIKFLELNQKLYTQFK